MTGCVVLNWNGWQDTLACLRSLAEQTAQPLHVCVVDNGSTNDSVERIRAFLGEVSSATVFTLIENGANTGFAKGSNTGIHEALRLGCDFVWLLNNDTVCPPDTLQKLLQVARTQPDSGVIGAVLLYYDDPAKVQAWGGGKVSRWSGTATHFVAPTPVGPGEYVTFASALIRCEVFHAIGLLYEGGFMYYEDADFCLRMEKTRWKRYIAADTAVLHKESASTLDPRDPFMEKTITVSGLKFLRRHSLFPLLSMPLFLLLKLGNRARLGAWSAFRAVLAGLREYRRQGS